MTKERYNKIVNFNTTGYLIGYIVKTFISLKSIVVAVAQSVRAFAPQVEGWMFKPLLR